MNLTAIDFEASCLPRDGRSFPIEVGVADERGARAWLIRPRQEWQGWGWTAQAEQLHGIDPASLERDGLPASQVVAELADAVRGRRLVADSALDDQWLGLLVGSAERASLPQIEHVSGVMDALATTDTEIEEACATLAAQPFRRHRAADDARWLHALITGLHSAAAARAGMRKAPPLFTWQRSRPNVAASASYDRRGFQGDAAANGPA